MRSETILPGRRAGRKMETVLTRGRLDLFGADRNHVFRTFHEDDSRQHSEDTLLFMVLYYESQSFRITLELGSSVLHRFRR